MFIHLVRIWYDVLKKWEVAIFVYCVKTYSILMAIFRQTLISQFPLDFPSKEFRCKVLQARCPSWHHQQKHTGLHLLCVHHSSCNTLLTAIFQDNPDRPVPECDVLIIPLERTVFGCPCPCPVLRPYRDWHNAQVLEWLQSAFYFNKGWYGGGGDKNSWSCKTYEAPVKLSPPAINTQLFIDQMPFLSLNQVYCMETES